MNAIAVGLAPPRDRALIKTSETLQVAHSRLMILMMVFALVTGVIGIRLLYLAVFNAPERSEPSPQADGAATSPIATAWCWHR